MALPWGALGIGVNAIVMVKAETSSGQSTLFGVSAVVVAGIVILVAGGWPSWSQD